MFNLADYQTVEERLSDYWSKCEDGRVDTEVIYHSPTQFIVKASIYRTYLDTVPWATGLAEETVSAKGVNSTSALENAETSAIGRALANAGFAPKGKRASAEEMSKVNRHAPSTTPASVIQLHKVEGTLTANQETASSFAESIFTNDEPVQEPRDHVISLAEGIDLIQQTMGGTVTQTCQHGERNFREGKKNGKAWAAWFCKANEKHGFAPCQPLWCKLSSSGQWYVEADA